jgi:hypothetical protein
VATLARAVFVTLAVLWGCSVDSSLASGKHGRDAGAEGVADSSTSDASGGAAGESGGGGSAGVAGSSGAGGVTDSGVPEAGLPCTCKDSRDVCSGSSCVRKAYTCNALNACDANYTCSAAGQCQCTNLAVCGILCGSAPCPSGLDCDHATSTCQTALSCLFDEACAPGERCVGVTQEQAGQCLRTGTDAVGASCTNNTDCATGRCYTGVCLTPCKASSECPSGQACMWEEGAGYVCVAGSCPASCAAGRACSPTGCETPCDSNSECGSGDRCMEGTSLVGLGSQGAAGACVSGTRTCAAGDMDGGFGNPLGATFKCLRDGGCWQDSDCPAGYKCSSVLGGHFCTE